MNDETPFPVMDGIDSLQQISPAVPQNDHAGSRLSASLLSSQQAFHVKVLLQALCYISRDVPLPKTLSDEVSSISYAHVDAENAGGSQRPSDRWMEEQNDKDPVSDQPKNVILPKDEEDDTSDFVAAFEEAVDKHRMDFSSSASLQQELNNRFKKKFTLRLHDLQEMPCFSEEQRLDRLIEMHGLKLAAIQRRVRADVMAEVHLQRACSGVNDRLFEWSLMRLVRTPSAFYGAMYGDGMYGLSASEMDERLRQKREAERQRCLEQEEQARTAIKMRKFFNELLNFVREMQLQVQAVLKRRKQRNDSVLAWHGKQRQRATRAERLRYQALRADDQEAYMRMVEESKNERLTTLLQKTDELLQSLGAMVLMQKDVGRAENVKKEKTKDKAKDSGKSNADLSSPRHKKQDAGKEKGDAPPPNEKDKHSIDAGRQQEDHYEGVSKKRDLLEGQRQYNSLVHSIEEKVTKQPAMLTGGELRPYQLEGLQWMLSLYNNNLNGILADEMGLGKTIQTIALLSYLVENKGILGPHLIIAPKAVLPNWAHEFATWAPSIVAILYDGKRVDRKDLRELYKEEGKFNVLITHYDLIMRDKAFLKKIHWDYMIVDEGHRLKNRDSILSRTLVNGYKIRRRLLLTGTPIQNSLQELWSLLNFLLPTIFNSCVNFEEWFNAPFADRSDMSLTEEEQLLIIRRLHQVIRPFLLRRKKTEVEKFLPSKAQIILKCDMSAWQRVYYQQITESGCVGLDSGTGKSKGLLNTAMQLRKCCNHPYLFLDGGYFNMYVKDEIVRASGKFELLDRLLPKLQRTGHRILLFSQMTRLLDILEVYLSMQGFKYLRLDGGTKTEDRGVLLAKFNAPDSPYFLFLLSTRAGGLGLNLQTADTVILFDSDWNPQMDQQAEDRAHRIGQKKEVRVFVLASIGTIEEDILDRAKSKMGIDAKVIQAGLFNTTSTAQERRELLEQIMRRGVDSLGTDVPSEREINRLSARSEEEFWLFEKMDEERRKKEGYKSRLIEEHEIPDWVFLLPKKGLKGTVLDGKLGVEEVTGKRKRKEVFYSDILSDSQWLKALEEGEDFSEAVKSELSRREKKAALLSEQTFLDDQYEDEFLAEMSAFNSEGGTYHDTQDTSASKKIKVHLDREEEDDDEEVEEEKPFKKPHLLKIRQPKLDQGSFISSSIHAAVEGGMNWKGLRRKRSSLSSQLHHESNGQSSSTCAFKDYSDEY